MKKWYEPKCPICGKRWEMYCTPVEWGYGSRDSLKPWKENALVLFCSRPCMDEYARRMQVERVRRLKQTTGFKIWYMYDQEYMTVGDIARELGMRQAAVTRTIHEVEERHWKDLDWLLANA